MSEKVRAKFKCNRVEKRSDGIVVHMNVVVSGSKENEYFSEYTPTGNLSINIDKGDAVNFFNEGESYYLDFSKAE